MILDPRTPVTPSAIRMWEGILDEELQELDRVMGRIQHARIYLEEMRLKLDEQEARATDLE